MVIQIIHFHVHLLLRVTVKMFNNQLIGVKQDMNIYKLYCLFHIICASTAPTHTPTFFFPFRDNMIMFKCQHETQLFIIASIITFLIVKCPVILNYKLTLLVLITS